MGLYKAVSKAFVYICVCICEYVYLNLHVYGGFDNRSKDEGLKAEPHGFFCFNFPQDKTLWWILCKVSFRLRLCYCPLVH